jgi:hypothetical protein
MDTGRRIFVIGIFLAPCFMIFAKKTWLNWIVIVWCLFLCYAMIKFFEESDKE